MLKTILVVVSWLQGGPFIQTQVLESPRICQLAAQAAVKMVEQQALTNMTSPHRKLTVAHDPKTQEWRISTGGIGREVARLQCLDAGLTPP